MCPEILVWNFQPFQFYEKLSKQFDQFEGWEIRKRFHGMLDKNVLLEAIIRMELPGTLPPRGFHTVRQVEFGSLPGSLYTHLGYTMSACFHRITLTGCWVQSERKPQLNSLRVRDLVPQLYLLPYLCLRIALILFRLHDETSKIGRMRITQIIRVTREIWRWLFTCAVTPTKASPVIEMPTPSHFPVSQTISQDSWEGNSDKIFFSACRMSEENGRCKLTLQALPTRNTWFDQVLCRY
jgi:hypothetical protein